MHGKSETSYIDESALADTSNYIFNIFATVGTIVAMLWGVGIGIKFMIESAEDKAKIKEALVPYVIGVFVLFSAFGIWKLAINIGDKTFMNTASPTPSTTYTQNTSTGKLYCDHCGGELSTREQHNGKCDCGYEIKNI